jgi:transcriptional regulator with XRE-family HTH domain
MQLSHAIRVARVYRGKKQDEIPGYSQQMVSMIEHGKRSVSPDAAPLLAKELDHPALFAALIRELTGGFGPAWLNGPNVDLHRASVREKTFEELHEAIEAMKKFAAYKPPDCETERDRQARYEHLMQVWDAMVALFHYIGIQCLEYGYSMMQLSRDHYNKLKGKRYVEA